jgi:hypothetical protein
LEKRGCNAVSFLFLPRIFARFSYRIDSDGIVCDAENNKGRTVWRLVKQMGLLWRGAGEGVLAEEERAAESGLTSCCLKFL